MKIKRKKSKKQVTKIIDEIKKNTSKIVFRTEKMLVTLRNTRQLEIFMKKFPEGVVEFK
jgi:hypothetical protein